MIRFGIFLASCVFGSGPAIVPPLKDRLLAADLIVEGRIAAIGEKTISVSYSRGYSPEYSAGTIQYAKIFKGKFNGGTIPISFPSRNADYYKGERDVRVGEEGIWLLRYDGIFTKTYFVMGWNPIPLAQTTTVESILHELGEGKPMINPDPRPVVKSMETVVENLEITIPKPKPMKAGKMQEVVFEFSEAVTNAYGLLNGTTIQFYPMLGSTSTRWRAEVLVPEFALVRPDKFLRLYATDTGGNAVIGTDRETIPAWWTRRGDDGRFPNVGYGYIKIPIEE